MSRIAMTQASLRSRLTRLSFKPIDQSTLEGRGRERDRRVAITALASALAKAISISTALISVPLTLHYLGSERFGMWMTISSLIAMLAFADFGIANGVLSAVASANGRDDRGGIQKIVATGFFLLLTIGCVIACVFALVYPFVDWASIFNVHSELARSESGPALAVFILCFALAVPLTVVQRVQMGLQMGFVVSLWQCIGSVFGLAGVLVAIWLKAGLPWLVLALAGAPLLAVVMNNISFYGVSRADLKPRFSNFSGAIARTVAGTGALYFVLQLTASLAYGSDSLVIAQLIGPNAVAQYSVPERLFSVISVAMALVLAPLWPAYGEAISRGDTNWVIRTLKKSLYMALGVSSLLSLTFVLIGPQIIKAWIGGAISIPLILLVSFAIWKIVEALGNSLAMLLNGMHVVRLQVLCAIPTALVALAAKVWLVPRIGPAGAILGSTLSYLVCTALPIGLCMRSLLNQKLRAG